MNPNSGPDLWYFLDIFDGIGVIFLFIFAVIWIRFLLMIFEDALSSANRSVPPASHFPPPKTSARTPHELPQGKGKLCI